MLIKLTSGFSLPLEWPVAAIVLLVVTIGSVHGESVSAAKQHHEMSSMAVQWEFGFFKESSLRFLASAGAPQIKHRKGWKGHYVGAGFFGWLWDRAKDVVNTGVDQVKSIASGTKNLVKAAGQITASGIAYATGNKDLGAKLANDAADSAKHTANDAIDLLASGGNLYNKTQAELNKVVPHLGTAVGVLVSLTPIGPEVAAAQGFADTKNAYENGGIKPALEAGGFAAINVLPGAVGKATKLAKGARAAEEGAQAAADLTKLGEMTKPAGAEAKVAANAAKPSKFLDYLEKGSKVGKPTGFVAKQSVPGRDRDKDGKLLGSGGSNFDNHRDDAKKLIGSPDQHQPGAGKATALPDSLTGSNADLNTLSPNGRQQAAKQLRAEQAAERNRAARDLAERQARAQTQLAEAQARAAKAEDEKRKAEEQWRTAYDKQQAELAKAQAARDKADRNARALDAKNAADQAARQLEATKKAAQDARNLADKMRADQQVRDLADKQEADRQKQQLQVEAAAQQAEEMRRHDQAEKEWRAEQERQRIAGEQRQGAEAEKQRLADEKRRAEQEEKQRLDNERIADQKRQAQEEERERLEQQRIAEQQREVEQEDKERLAEEKRQAAADEKQRLADEQRRTQEEAAAAQSKTNQMQATHTEDEEVQAQKEYLSKLRAQEQQNQQPRPKASPADEDQSGDDQNE